jgi:hypothetical protein
MEKTAIELLKEVLKDNYDLDNNREIDPGLRDEIEDFLCESSDGLYRFNKIAEIYAKMKKEGNLPNLNIKKIATNFGTVTCIVHPVLDGKIIMI